jgi:hypothetical protein
MGDPIPAPFAGHGSATMTIADKAAIDGAWAMTSYLFADPALLQGSAEPSGICGAAAG